MSPNQCAARQELSCLQSCFVADQSIAVVTSFHAPDLFLYYLSVARCIQPITNARLNPSQGLGAREPEGCEGTDSVAKTWKAPGLRSVRDGCNRRGPRHPV